MHEFAEKAYNPLATRALLRTPMPSSDARTRIRQRIRRLLEDRGKTNRSLGQWLGHGDQWVSNLLAGRFSLSLDELDRVALFFAVPPGEIVRISEEPWELSPTEMRVVRALRMLPPPVRDDYARYADYLIGTVPDEMEDLVILRELTEENRATVRRWAEMLRTAQARGRDAAGLDDLLRLVEPPTAPTRRSPPDRTKRKAGRKSG